MLNAAERTSEREGAPTYRAYTIGPNDRIIGSQDIPAADDDTAFRLVQELKPGCVYELWEGARKVRRVRL